MAILEKVIVAAVGSVWLMSSASAAELTVVEVKELIGGKSVYLELYQPS